MRILNTSIYSYNSIAISNKNNKPTTNPINFKAHKDPVIIAPGEKDVPSYYDDDIYDKIIWDDARLKRVRLRTSRPFVEVTEFNENKKVNLLTHTEGDGFMSYREVWEPENSRYKIDTFSRKEPAEKYRYYVNEHYKYCDPITRKINKTVMRKESQASLRTEEYDYKTGDIKELHLMKQPEINIKTGRLFQAREECYGKFDTSYGPSEVISETKEVYDIMNGKNNLIRKSVRKNNKNVLFMEMEYGSNNKLTTRKITDNSGSNEIVISEKYYKNGIIKSSTELYKGECVQKHTDYNKDGSISLVKDYKVYEGIISGPSSNLKSITYYENDEPIRIEDKINNQTLVYNKETQTWEKEEFQYDDLISKALENSSNTDHV